SSAPPAPATDGSSWDAVGSGARCTSLAPLSQAASASRAMRGRVRCPARTLFLLLLFRRRILTDRPLPDAPTHETRFLLQAGYSSPNTSGKLARARTGSIRSSAS